MGEEELGLGDATLVMRVVGVGGDGAAAGGEEDGEGEGEGFWTSSFW